MKKYCFVFYFMLSIFFGHTESVKNIKPLESSEFLKYSYSPDNYVLTIIRTDGKSESVYLSSEDSLWGGYQISEDNKKMIFWKDTYERNMPLYYLNGEKGKMKHIGKIPVGARMDKTGNFLMYEKDYNSGKFHIINMNDGDIKEFSLTLSNIGKWTSTGATFSVLRAADNGEYDFMILFTIEKLVISKIYVKASGLHYVDFDDSNLSELKLRKTIDYKTEYTGWY